MSRRAAWIWRGAAVLLAALPTLVPLVRFGHTSEVGWFAYAPLNGSVMTLRVALIGFLEWQRYTDLGVPILIAAVPLAARGRRLRPVAIAAAALLVLVAATGLYFGAFSGFAMDGLAGMRGASASKAIVYLLAAFALVIVAVRGSPGGRSQPVVSETP